MWPHGLYSPWNSAGQNTGVGSLSLLQGIFPSQGSNPGLPHCRRILYQLSHKGSPRILEWVAYPFSRGSSQSRDWTGGSCIAGRFFTSWAIRDPKYVCVCVCVCLYVGVFIHIHKLCLHMLRWSLERYQRHWEQLLSPVEELGERREAKNFHYTLLPEISLHI